MAKYLNLYFFENINPNISYKKLSKKDKRRLKNTQSLLSLISFKKSRTALLKVPKKRYITLSHKQQACVIVSSSNKVGVDMEILENREFHGIADFCFNDKEKQYSTDIIKFYQIFTLKEALIKAKNLSFSHLHLVSIFNEKKYNFKSFIINNKYIISVVFKGKKDIILNI